MRRQHTAVLVPLLVLLASIITCVSAVGLPKHLRLPSINECRIGSAKFSGLGHYINGTKLDPGSIYADCVYGIATCYRDDGTNNKSAHEQVHCPTDQDHQSTYRRCRVGDMEFNGYAHYIVGKLRIPGSVYADCVEGTPRCFVDDGIPDKMDAEVPCDEVEIDQQRRQLGLFGTKEKGHSPWPDRVVCYRVNDGFTKPGLEMFERGIREFQEKGKITWIKSDECKSTYGEDTAVCLGCKISVLVNDKNPGCYASAGVLHDFPNYDYEMNLGPDCQVYDTYLHEMGHVVGLFHEHNHPDRQVVILRKKLRVPSSNYAKIFDSGKAAYDMGSVMHYDGGDMCVPKDLSLTYCDVEEAEGTNGCVEPKDDHCDTARQNDFGQAKDLALSDVQSIELMYAGINPHPKSPQFGTGAVSPPPPPDATTTAPPPPDATTTAPPPPDATSTAPPPPDATTTVPPPPDATSTAPPPPDATTTSPPPPDATSTAPPDATTTAPPPDATTTAPPPPDATTTAPPPPDATTTASPPPDATTTAPPPPEATTTVPPLPPTPSTSTLTPTPPTIPGINFDNIYDVLAKLSGLLSRRTRRLRQ